MGKRKRPGKAERAPAQARVLSREQISITRETDYIIQCAENREARMVTLGALILFATETGDAWVLDAEDNLALCLARDGERQPFKVMETANSFGIDWKANYRLDDDRFIVIEPEGRVRSILGYPTREIRQAMRRVG